MAQGVKSRPVLKPPENLQPGGPTKGSSAANHALTIKLDHSGGADHRQLRVTKTLNEGRRSKQFQVCNTLGDCQRKEYKSRILPLLRIINIRMIMRYVSCSRKACVVAACFARRTLTF